jgi:hypothetical protein
MVAISANAQGFKTITLPEAIAGVNEEFSGMTAYKERIYLIPQYGDHKETLLNGEFNIYSISADSIQRVIDRKEAALTNFRTIRVAGLDQLPDSVKHYYQGFEAITMVDDLSIETDDQYAYCFLLKGKLDIRHNLITIDPKHFSSIRRYPAISNAGFESVAYVPALNKLVAFYEFNAMANGGVGYLIDTALNHPPKQIKAPFLYFRLTDINANQTGAIYGINYWWNGDYEHYLDNDYVKSPENKIKQVITSLRDSLNNNPTYLRQKTFARIVKLNHIRDKQWKQVALFDGYKNNWEGIALFGNGALIITDANRSSKQLTTFCYVAFPPN